MGGVGGSGAKDITHDKKAQSGSDVVPKFYAVRKNWEAVKQCTRDGTDNRRRT